MQYYERKNTASILALILLPTTGVRVVPFPFGPKGPGKETVTPVFSSFSINLELYKKNTATIDVSFWSSGRKWTTGRM